MRFICAILGFLLGKRHVKCLECKNLDAENKCYGHKMPDEILNKAISCGFYKVR